MNRLPRLAIRRPVTTCMVFLSLAVFGLIATRLLPLEFFPDVDFPGMMVEIPYPGSSPEEVEQLIARPVEEALATMNGATGFDNIEIDLAMNEHLDGMRAYEVPNPARTVMFFEVPDGSETVGGRDLLADEPHYPDGYLIVFVDSHTEYVPADQIDDLVWDPRSDNGN